MHVKIIFIVTGLAVIAGCLFWGYRVHRFKSAAAPAEGQVIQLNRGGSHPQVRFTTADGITVEQAQGGLVFGCQVGDSLRILYNPENPRQAKIDSFGALWGFPVLGLVLGAAFLSAGFFSKA